MIQNEEVTITILAKRHDNTLRHVFSVLNLHVTLQPSHLTFTYYIQTVGSYFMKN